jgi:hypothetical protein
LAARGVGRRAPVGYGPELAVTGFHPLDGARWLAAQGHDRLAGLVAHHSRARFEADELGLSAALDEFADACSAVSDALTYCDLTTGPAGERVTAAERLAGVEQRYNPDSAVARAQRCLRESAGNRRTTEPRLSHM